MEILLEVEVVEETSTGIDIEEDDVQGGGEVEGGCEEETEIEVDGGAEVDRGR